MSASWHRQLSRCYSLCALKATKRHPPPEVLRQSIVPRRTRRRRQVTVMFSDLVGSTAPLRARASTRRRTARGRITLLRSVWLEPVRRFDGFVAKLVYFGYPQAHEDDAERAVPSGAGTGLDRKCAERPVRAGRVVWRSISAAPFCVDPWRWCPCPDLHPSTLFARLCPVVEWVVWVVWVVWTIKPASIEMAKARKKLRASFLSAVAIDWLPPE